MAGLVAMCRLIIMSSCWSFLGDYLWVAAVAYARDAGQGPSFLGLAFALNLGSRLLPNMAVTQLGLKSEFLMISMVIAGYSVSFLYPADVWAFLFMAFTSGMSFLRVCLTLHIQTTFSEHAEQLGKACKYAGAAKNLGSILAMIVPIALYQQWGWQAVCLGALAASAVYLVLAILQHCSQRNTKEEVQVDETSDVQNSDPVAWIDWILGFAFIITELQYNIGNAAIPQTLTKAFGMDMGAVGPLLAVLNGACMCFLALLPVMPCTLLHRNPVNIVLAFLLILLAWILASVAAFSPEGLAMFVGSVLLFMLAVNMAQVLLLEYLSNVLNAQGSKRLLGFSETLGCGFAMLGGYLGDVLEIYGDAAPFMMQSVVALVAVSVLGACLGYRHVTRRQLLRREDTEDMDAVSVDIESLLGVKKTLKACAQQSLAGVRLIVTSTSQDSLARVESEYRKTLKLGLPSLAAPLLDDSTDGSSLSRSSSHSSGLSSALDSSGEPEQESDRQQGSGGEDVV